MMTWMVIWLWPALDILAHDRGNLASASERSPIARVAPGEESCGASVLFRNPAVTRAGGVLERALFAGTATGCDAHRGIC
jgi:hypothetical protein